MIWMKLLHQGPVRADDFRGAAPFGKTKDFVEPPGATWRRRPPRSPAACALTLVCLTPAGEPAVEICL